jgi:hypothetical protein
MVKFRVKANPSGQYYFPKEVRQELGRELTLLCDAKAAVVFPVGTHLNSVLESVDIILRDLKHRMHLQAEDSKH